MESQKESTKKYYDFIGKKNFETVVLSTEIKNKLKFSRADGDIEFIEECENNFKYLHCRGCRLFLLVKMGIAPNNLCRLDSIETSRICFDDPDASQNYLDVSCSNYNKF